MAFSSILFDGPQGDADLESLQVPAYFSDLHLDQIVEAVTAGREEYNLRPFFWLPLDDGAAIAYRHEVLRDLERGPLLPHVEAFRQGMRAMRAHLEQAEKLYYEYQKAAWFRDAVEIYCDAVHRLADGLSQVEVRSRGFQALREHLAAYAQSEGFRSLEARTIALRDELSQIRYCVHIRGNRVTVTLYAAEPSYTAEVEETFRKFRQGDVKDYRVGFHTAVEMNHVEASVLDQVARLFPDVFLALKEFAQNHPRFVDDTVRRFDREVQFYVAYLEFAGRLRKHGLQFCHPRICEQSKEVWARDTFDLALATRRAHEGLPVVCNDFHLQGRERVFVVSGPNQGGKTTFARTFGQLHHLARLGCPVPGTEAQLYLCDCVFTHFEREEYLDNLRGKLQDELLRVREILQQATARSIVILNETFASTALQDALFLGREALQEIIRRDMLCVYVTFVEELSQLDEATVSMVSTIVPDNPAVRTYKVVRRPADGLAHASAIAQKYGLTYASLKRRVAR